MKIAFYAGSCLPIHARTLEERPLGGTETALIRLAEVLQCRGHEVTVFTAHQKPHPSVPRYLPSEAVHSSSPYDVFVCVKDWRPALSGAPGKRFFYWTGDGFDQYINFGLGDARVSKKIEKFLAVSAWHRDTLCDQSGFPLSKTEVIYNGVYATHFLGSEPRRRRQLIYTAAPYRGLALVPAIYGRLLQKYPDLELKVFAGLSVYDTDKPFQGPQVREFESLKRQLVTLPGCTLCGNARQAELARELMRSALFVYPNTTFETFCITALEAEAAGCPVIASANSALPETVGDAGRVIAGTPGSSEYLEEFVGAADELLGNDAAWEQCSQAGLRKVRTCFTWEHVADRFEALL